MNYKLIGANIISSELLLCGGLLIGTGALHGNATGVWVGLGSATLAGLIATISVLEYLKNKKGGSANETKQ